MSIKTITCKKHAEITLEGGYAICYLCGVCRPLNPEKRVPLRPIHRIILADLFRDFPQHFLKNRTCFFYSEMWRYIFEKKVYRIRIMGETRGGKSESAQTIAINYTRIFNALFKIGHFKNIEAAYESGKKVEVKSISVEVEHIHANQASYLYSQRDATREEKLSFGQIHAIDEDRENPGGIGSFSEEMETENINNIVAMFMQSEIWIKPKRFENTNTPYGLNCQIKDEENRLNWSLLYKIEMNSSGLREQNFLGWVSITVHTNKPLRQAYIKKKTTWISQELKGTANPRSERRMVAINKMLDDPFFTQNKMRKDGTIGWVHGIESMKFLVEKAMMEQKIDPFNDTEIERIVHGARALGEQRLAKKKEEL